MNTSGATSPPQRGNTFFAGLGAATLNLAGPITSGSMTLQSPLKGILLCLLATFIIFYARSSRKKLPPRFRRLPIIGGFFGLTDKRWFYSRESKERFREYQPLKLD